MLFSLPPLPHAWIYRDVFLKNVMFPIINFHSLLSSSYTLFCWGICIMSLNYYLLLTINVFDCVPFEMTISICLVFILKFSYLTSFLVDSLLSLVLLLAWSDSFRSVNLFLFEYLCFEILFIFIRKTLACEFICVTISLKHTIIVILNNYHNLHSCVLCMCDLCLL